jgi:two-component system, OmpR family, catabolic regulation response regulator CreB
MQTAQRSMFIIEDDARFRETFIDVMQLRGMDVRAAGTAAEGLRALQKDAVPSVIVLDVQLPDAHGFDLCRLIKRMDRFKDTPVIFLSASTQYLEVADRAEGMLAGASLFLPKPITMDRLCAEIDALLKNR